MSLGRKGVALLAATAACLVFLAGVFAGERRIVSIGSETIDTDDVLLRVSAGVGDSGDGLRTGLALVQMGERGRKELVGQMTDELLCAIAAKDQALDRDPEVARMLRWQEIHTLAGLYLTAAARSWDLGDASVHRYFDQHPEEFVDAEAVRIKYLTMKLEYSVDSFRQESKSGATLADIAKKHAEHLIESDLIESDWMEKGLVRQEFAPFFFTTTETGLLDPIVAKDAIYLVDIVERRPPRQLFWEEARPEASQRLHRSLLQQEMDVLRKRYEVQVDEKMLEALSQLAKP